MAKRKNLPSLEGFFVNLTKISLQQMAKEP